VSSRAPRTARSSRSPQQTIRLWVQAFNDRDADAASRLYHADAVNLQLALGNPLVGRKAIRADLAAFFRDHPDNVTRVENLLEDGEWAALEWSGSATFAGNGKRFRLRGCGFFRVQDGLIVTQRGYWDKLTWHRQVGIPA
jgi:steroid delta-isomerase-like uncharacterized protein